MDKDVVETRGWLHEGLSFLSPSHLDLCLLIRGAFGASTSKESGFL